jgi:hypothetical protein
MAYCQSGDSNKRRYKMIRTKIASVKPLNQNNPRWMKDKQIPGMYFNDTVKKIRESLDCKAAVERE